MKNKFFLNSYQINRDMAVINIGNAVIHKFINTFDEEELVKKMVKNLFLVKGVVI